MQNLKIPDLLQGDTMNNASEAYVIKKLCNIKADRSVVYYCNKCQKPHKIKPRGEKELTHTCCNTLYRIKINYRKTAEIVRVNAVENEYATIILTEQAGKKPRKIKCRITNHTKGGIGIEILAAHPPKLNPGSLFFLEHRLAYNKFHTDEFEIRWTDGLKAGLQYADKRLFEPWQRVHAAQN